MITNSKIFNPQAKVLLHYEKIEKFLTEGNVDPILIELDPSNACNHSCPFCISGHIHFAKFKGTEFFNRAIMGEKNLMNLVKEIVTMNIQAINWTGGGEPTMNPNLKKAIKYIRENSKIKMGMFSNGTMLKKFDMFDELAKSLTWIRISLDAGNEKSYNDLRVTNKNNDFKTVIENIKELIRVKKLASNLCIGTGFVVTKDNYNEIIEFAELFKDLDVDYCQFKPEIVQIEREGGVDRSKEQISSNFWLHDVVDVLEKAKSILGNKFECNAYKLEDLIMNPDNYGRNYKECLGSQLQPCIGADGNVYVCTNHRGHKNYAYGNIFEKSFKEVWNDLKSRKCVMQQIETKEKFSKCSQLCKPHESNKIVWAIKNNLNNQNYIKDIKEKSKNLEKK